jgi:lipopolysaccharide transport system ATP-binding protein
MHKPIISVRNLSKKFTLGERQPYYSFRDTISNVFHTKLHRKKLKEDEFWALKGVSFDINEGDVVGIIGRNGAGKSTLLKILSQITPPTEGRVQLKGRVASLLEVGTGFHPELTGRENIYLNGAILGMKRWEINKKFKEIVDFSETEEFLDTPVKHYSSGMYMRLAFAVAAHLEPEILLIDEVLSVGDAQFQRKCLGKMSEVSKQGRTIIYVSHNLNSIEELCNRCILLDKGKLIENSSDVRGTINKYLFQENNKVGETSEWSNTDNKFNNCWFKPESIYISDKNGDKLKMPLTNDQEFYLNIKATIEKIDPALTVGYAIYDENRLLIYWSYQTDTDQGDWPILKKGSNLLTGSIPQHLLNEGTYFVELIGGLHYRQWLFEPGKDSPKLSIQIKGGLSDSPYWMAKRPGIIAPIIKWTSRV